MPGRCELRVPKDVVCEVLDGEAILLNLRTGVYFSLNRSGTRMWQALAKYGNQDAAVPALLAELDLQGQDSRLRADLARLTQDLVSAGLLEVEEW